MKIKFAITALCAALLTGCGVAIKYSLSGASIPPDAKTFSVAYFPNNATMVAPILSSTLTDALVDMFTRRTRLMQVEEGGDFAFEGEITNYMSATSSVSTDDYAVLNRLRSPSRCASRMRSTKKCRSTGRSRLSRITNPRGCSPRSRAS